jgi:type I restriction enzyme S subunit
MTRLRDLGDWSGGNTPSKANAAYWTDGTVPWVSPKDMKVDEITSSEDRVSKVALDEGRVSLLPEGSVLVVTRSGILAHTLPVAVAQMPVTINQDLKALTPRAGVSPKYVAHALRGASRRILKECSKHGTTVASIETNALLDFEIPMVDLNRQHRIVAELEKQFSRLDEALANLKRVKANLKRYRAAVLIHAVQGQLVETQAAIAEHEGHDYETGDQLLRRVLEAHRSEGKASRRTKEPIEPELAQLPDLPDGWVWASIDQLAAAEARAITDGPFGSNLKSEHYVSAGPRVIRLQNIKDGEFADEYAHISAAHFAKLRKHEVFAGDLVIASLGDNPPRSCVIPPYVGPAIVKADCIRFKPHPSVSAAYLNVALNCQPTRARMKDVLHGIGRPRLSLGEIRAIALPIPPEVEQHRIVAEVERRLSLVRGIEAAIDANLRRGSSLRSSVLGGFLAVEGPDTISKG